MSDLQTPSSPPERPGQPVVSLDGAQTGDISIGDVAGGDIYKPTIINQAKLSREEQQEQRNRTALLGLVRRFWVEGVLHESLHQRVLIELGIQARPDAIEHPWRNIVRLPGQAPQPLASGQPISAVFKHAGGRLLILGAPGGGKTTTLLTLAEQLLDAAMGDDSLPIPVVFQLSTWAVSRPALADWLVAELKERYKVPPKVGKTWVDDGTILPLLDGLDEVGPSDTERAACVQAINTYLGEAGAQAAVCSRSVEYAQLGGKLNLDAALEVQPLDAAQMAIYLAGFGASLSGLRAALAEDATLGNLAASPLLLSVMALAYHDIPASDLVGQERDIAYQRLWADYVRHRLALERADARTDPRQLRAWLIWLARGMQAHGQQVFYVEYLQSSWLATQRQRRLARLQTFLVGGLGVGLALGLLFGLSFGLGVAFLPAWYFGLVAEQTSFLVASVLRDRYAIWFFTMQLDLAERWGVGLSYSLVYGLTIGLGGGLLSAIVGTLSISLGGARLTETLTWDVRRALSRQRLGRHVLYGLSLSLGISILGILSYGFAGLFGGFLISGLVSGLVFGLGGALGSTLIGCLVGGVSFGLVSGQLAGLSYALMIIVVNSLVGLLGGGLGSVEIQISSQPNEGIRRSQRSMVIGGILYSLVVGFGVGVPLGLFRVFNASLVYGPGLGLAVGLPVGMLLYGGAAVIRHYILRILLHRRCGAPWDFAATLDEAVSRTLMTRVGGGYRFYHRLLQEHFAEHAQSELSIAPILGPQPGDVTTGRRAQG